MGVDSHMDTYIVYETLPGLQRTFMLSFPHELFLVKLTMTPNLALAEHIFSVSAISYLNFWFYFVLYGDKYLLNKSDQTIMN